jgi:dienelactone hydrolase
MVTLPSCVSSHQEIRANKHLFAEQKIIVTSSHLSDCAGNAVTIDDHPAYRSDRHVIRGKYMFQLRSIVLAAATGLLPALLQPAFAEPVSFSARDGVQIYGDFRNADGQARGMILLFHMAGSNKGEYAPLAPILNKAGFATLAVDLRSGGDLWNGVNQTVASAKADYNYADAIPDLDASIDYAEAKHAGPLAVWGSSYSSALVFIAAASHPEVKALLAFSPAEYITGHSIKNAAAKLSIPVFITSAPDSGEVSAGMALADAVQHRKAVQYVPNHGVHGSSTLRRDENPEGADENWKHVMAFLDNAFSR